MITDHHSSLGISTIFSLLASHRGPLQIRLEQEYPLNCEMRLAMTVWARGSFRVTSLYPAAHSSFEKKLCGKHVSVQTTDGCCTQGCHLLASRTGIYLAVVPNSC